MNVPKRRGRPPRAETQIAGPDGDTISAPAIARAMAESPLAEPAAPTRRRKRADVNGQHLKLSAPSRDGFQRRWVNDKPGRVAMFEELAYSHVRDTSIKSDGTDDRIRRLVGTQEGGAPLYAYLMETPLEEYQYGVEEKEESRRSFEETIRRGEDPLGSPLTARAQSHTSSIS